MSIRKLILLDSHLTAVLFTRLVLFHSFHLRRVLELIEALVNLRTLLHYLLALLNLLRCLFLETGMVVALTVLSGDILATVIILLLFHLFSRFVLVEEQGCPLVIVTILALRVITLTGLVKAIACSR